MIIEYTTNRDELCVMWEDENGVGHSMLKSAYDEMQAQQVEHLTEIPPQAALSTPMVTGDE